MAADVQVSRARSLDGLAHGFLGRLGGVSHGEVAGLNVGLGSGDDRSAIAENRRRAVAAVSPGRQLATVYQVHSADCVTAGDPWADDARPHADALVTDRPDLVLGIVTADCAPVLFAGKARLAELRTPPSRGWNSSARGGIGSLPRWVHASRRPATRSTTAFRCAFAKLRRATPHISPQVLRATGISTWRATSPHGFGLAGSQVSSSLAWTLTPQRSASSPTAAPAISAKRLTAVRYRSLRWAEAASCVTKNAVGRCDFRSYQRAKSASVRGPRVPGTLSAFGGIPSHS
jgi:hypothetical protein